MAIGTSVSAIDQAFAHCGQRNRKLNGRAGLRAARERELLIDHGENAAAGRFDRDHGAIHVAERVDGSRANSWIFAGSDIAFRDVRGNE